MHHEAAKARSLNVFDRPLTFSFSAPDAKIRQSDIGNWGRPAVKVISASELPETRDCLDYSDQQISTDPVVIPAPYERAAPTAGTLDNWAAAVALSLAAVPCFCAQRLEHRRIHSVVRRHEPARAK